MENFKERVSRTAVKIAASTPFTIVRMVFLGLGLYYLDMILDGKLSIGYLNERNCHPNLPKLTIPNVTLSNILTKGFKFNAQEFSKPKYQTAFMGRWGSEAVQPEVWFGDEESRIKIEIFPAKAYMTHIISSIMHVFDGDFDSNFQNVCSVNGASIAHQPDEIFLTFCAEHLTNDSITGFRGIFKSLNPKEKRLFRKLFTECNVPAVTDAIKQKNFTNMEGQKCLAVIGTDPFFILKLISIQEKINMFIKGSGLGSESNWTNNIHGLFDKCWKNNITFECNNKNIDDCPSGNLQYGILTLLAIFFPGVLFAISEFSYYKYFRFGGYAEKKQLGIHWPLIVKLIMMPIYASLMAPFLIILTTIE